MKSGLRFLIMIMVLGLFFYSINPEIKAKVDNWINLAQADSAQSKLQSDTTSDKFSSTKRAIKRQKIPKRIAPGIYAHLDKYARETPDKYSRNNVLLAK